MPQQLAEDLERGAAADQQACKGVAEIVDPDTGQFCLFKHANPEPADFLDRLAGRVAGKQARVAARHQQSALAQDGDNVVRDRDAMDIALLDCGGRLRPAQEFEVELFEPRLPNLTDPLTGQHAEPDDPGRALVLRGVQHLGETTDLFRRHEPFALRLDPAPKAASRVVGAHGIVSFSGVKPFGDAPSALACTAEVQKEQQDRYCCEDQAKHFSLRTIYDQWHYVPVLVRKPGALRNGLPLKDRVLPGALEKVRRKPKGVDDGDRQMVDILAAVLTESLPAVEAACAEPIA